ncbi:hypothetical protein KKG48_01030 [Patescibacteria group bacterium]|nr:hypothetical protein [Patescibacteria group bacterium]MCG2695204.1 hypothetical protein [Candidatus Parcubacteria bacterium]
METEETLKKTKLFWDNNYFLILSLILLFLIILLQPQQMSLVPIFFGDSKIAMFDLWSIQHFLTGVLIGSLLLNSENRETKKWQKIIPFILFLALGWELAEIYLETGVVLKNWTGFEHWTNRMIADPFVTLMGGITGYSVKDSWKIAIVPVVMWLVIKAIII